LEWQLILRQRKTGANAFGKELNGAQVNAWIQLTDSPDICKASVGKRAVVRQNDESDIERLVSAEVGHGAHNRVVERVKSH